MTTLSHSVFESPGFAIDEFLAQEREKDLFRFTTAGSVDDGKSTLIGRLLYDTQSVYEDQVRSIEGKGTTAPGQIDFSLLTDGLRAEREQGITIDVAYRYFSTARRKFIIADTPGHEQYTRNMATGASTADAAVVLIDAAKGVLLQSRRHATIASLLRVKHILVAVNKMDLIGYDEVTFRSIERDFKMLLEEIASDTGNPVESIFVPVSALRGENIVHRAGPGTDPMPWYRGPSLLQLLESLPASVNTTQAPFRFPVQRVLRPDHTFRGFAGQIASGTIRTGDKIEVQPSGKSAQVARIVTWDGDLDEAYAPLSVTLVLDRELDISRGDLIVAAEAPTTVSKSLQAALVWMDERPLEPNRRYLLKHASHTVPAYVSKIEHRTDIATLSRLPADALEMNAIGVVSIQLLRPIALDLYSQNRGTGAFILIDPETNGTAAAGMVSAASAFEKSNGSAAASDREPVGAGRVKPEERAARWGHRGGLLELSGPVSLIDSIERTLFVSGAITLRAESERAIRSLVESGIIALVAIPDETGTLLARSGSEHVELRVDDPDQAVSSVIDLLARSGILNSVQRAGVQ
jgi:sulfate adenylyltransferase large subunit